MTTDLHTELQTPWPTYVEWSQSDHDLILAVRGDFKISVRYEAAPWGTCPRPTWHWRVEYQNIMACEGFYNGTDGDDVAVRACQRTAVKMAAFHGMPLAPEIMRKVAGLLVDPMSRDRNPTVHKATVAKLREQGQDALADAMEALPPPARRVALDGHSPKALRRAAAPKAAAAKTDDE